MSTELAEAVAPATKSYERTTWTLFKKKKREHVLHEDDIRCGITHKELEVPVEEYALLYKAYSILPAHEKDPVNTYVSLTRDKNGFYVLYEVTWYNPTPLDWFRVTEFMKDPKYSRYLQEVEYETDVHGSQIDIAFAVNVRLESALSEIREVTGEIRRLFRRVPVGGYAQRFKRYVRTFEIKEGN